MIKRIFYILIIIVLGSLITDYVLTIRFSKEPIFTFKEDADKHLKYGLIYKVYINESIDLSDGLEHVSREFYIFNKKVDDVKIMASNFIDAEVIDKTKGECEKILFKFYEDETYKYFLDCKRDIYIKSSGIEYTLEDALNKKIINMDELRLIGLKYLKESK
ncbi:MAG: hypothetical protein RR478_02660 [Bacilli bacterium]